MRREGYKPLADVARSEEKSAEDKNKVDAKPRKLNMKRLLSQARPERALMVVATIALFLGAIFNLVIPGFVGAIIDAIANPDTPADQQAHITRLIKYMGFTTPKQILTVSVIGLSIDLAVMAFFNFLRGYLFTLAGERVVARLRKNLFSSLISFEIGFFDVTRTGELTNRMAADTTILKDATTVNISMGLRWLSTVVGGIIYLFLISWKLTLVMLSVVPLVVICARLYGKKIRDVSKDTQEALARATEVAEESFTHIRTVRSFSREPAQEQLYFQKIDTTYQLGAKMALLYGLFVGLVGLVGSGSIVLVLWYGATLVLNKQMTAGVLTSFVLYTLTVAVALGGLSGLFGSFLSAIGANERVFELLDRKGTIPLTGGRRVDHIEGNVHFENVSFSYPSRRDQIVLKNVTLTMKPGTVTALVGPSGGGKSTIVKLIERFYEADSGDISIDGFDIRSLDPSLLHRHIALVDQEPVLFARTIRDNIMYGIDGATDEQIREAARKANADEFICGFKEQYDSLVGERGVRLSGGQKQRVAIARAILMDPKILIADEATSSLDAESEFRVQEALDRLMKGRTVLVVAHRLSTVKNADNVIVIENGQLVEQGTHSDLLARSGTYAKLVRRQLTGGELKADDESVLSEMPSQSPPVEREGPVVVIE